MFDQWPLLGSIMHIIGNVLIALGVVSVYLGLLGIWRFQHFTLRLLSSAKVDTIGLILVLLGVAVRSGISWFSAKALLIVSLVLITTPIVTSQLVARNREDEPELP